jgi:hypothetical protein
VLDLILYPFLLQRGQLCLALADLALQHPAAIKAERVQVELPEVVEHRLHRLLRHRPARIAEPQLDHVGQLHRRHRHVAG